ncbi:MAG: GNAT family N-acetyltransferase [Rickettsiales bacterium]|jgi:GNAT superfamily N-acetyltransferase|nr:GNAT family N-acetyltransferase [Rickettsiales bacterium]
MDKAQINIRKALRDDVPEIVRIISDNSLGASREDYRDDLPQSYYDAFDIISRDHHQLLIVSEIAGKIVGTLQISYLSNMSVRGASRALIEGMHVDSKCRSLGVGSYMMQWVIAEAKAKGCNIAQLTSNKQRRDAHRFYAKHGFVATHEGFKLDLSN